MAAVYCYPCYSIHKQKQTDISLVSILWLLCRLLASNIDTMNVCVFVSLGFFSIRDKGVCKDILIIILINQF